MTRDRAQAARVDPPVLDARRGRRMSLNTTRCLAGDCDAERPLGDLVQQYRRLSAWRLTKQTRGPDQ